VTANNVVFVTHCGDY